VAADTDQVTAFLPMPPGSKLNNVWLDVSVLSESAVSIFSSLMYGLSGFVVDVDDPDTTHSYDYVWDSMVQKDVPEGHNILSIDTATQNTAPEFGQGELDLFQIFGDNLTGNMQLYQRREFLTFPKRPIAYDPSNDTFFGMDAFKVHVRGGPTVTRPSVAMFGFSSPALDQTQSYSGGALGTTPTEREWIITMYAEVFLYDMWKHLIGVITTTSSAEPFDEVSAWFAKLMEDKMYETATSRIIPSGFHVHTKATWDMSVVGKPGKAILTSD
jgi:hypothetical protein